MRVEDAIQRLLDNEGVPIANGSNGSSPHPLSGIGLQRRRALEEGKPENVLDRIVEGRMKDFYSRVCLLEQPFVKDDKMSIRDYIKSAIAKFGENVSISRFCRFQLGEKI